MIKTLIFFKRRPGLSAAAFQEYWRTAHAALPGVCRYVQCRTRRSAYESGRTPAFDGAALAWLDGIPAPLEAQEAFAAPERSRQLLARELVVLAAAR